jgi:2'-5' RNA ligase
MDTFQQNKKDENIRAFIAITLPLNIIHHITNLQTTLKNYRIKASWPKPMNMHLTLKFLGNIPCNKVEGIHQGINNAAVEFKKDNAKLQLFTEGLGVFPSVKKSRIIWTGVKDQDGALVTVQSLLERHLEKKGFKREKKHFSPHITLCRLKQSVAEKSMIQILKNYSGIKSDTFLINSFTLFKSKLTSSGPVHEKLFSEKI